MDRLLKHIQRVRPTAFCSRDFFLLHDNSSAHKFASFCQILSPKNVTTLYHSPVLSRFISARIFSVPQVENEVKRTPFWVCCWDPRRRNWWIKEGQKRGIFGSFSENVRQRKSLFKCQWSFFLVKKKCLPHVLRVLKKSVLILLGRTLYWYMLTCLRNN